ncbi:diguanylate cyclase [Geomonas sp. RF6]|uniref:GGDEF domain-containing response regulator n=1 Tax=Geomonas sp. RF6 TaxID=2897342 RepID=UPI001E2E22F7|nr:diguanylate cyclase [Geomonas sp. RF6]UFS69914.1 diguanylate cyclase [Geomonas sp. RF6]
MPSSVLVIDDSQLIREQVVCTLRSEGLFDQYRVAHDGLEGFKSLVEGGSDLVICDVEMPRMNGFKFLQLVNSRPELSDIPIIMLTVAMDPQSKIRGLNEGASDYVTKPFDAGELVARVRVQMKIKSLQDELKRANALLKELNNLDHLTNLYNRRYLTEVLEKEFVRVKRSSQELTLVILDIDRFKKINDTYGHQCGDAVLAEIAAVTKASLRTYDIAARYGGEEFVLLLPSTSLSDGVVVAERLRQAVQAISWPAPMRDLAVTVSLGVATYPSPLVDGVESLFRHADEALYRAKIGGRNRVEAMLVPR